MTAQRKRQALWLATAAIFAASVVVAVSAVMLPYSRADLSGARRAVGPIDSGPARRGSGLPPLAAFEPLMALDLRHALVEGTSTEVRAAPPLTIKLTGTMVDPDQSTAVFQLPDGNVELKKVGDRAGEAEILAITETSVTVLYYGRQVTLSLEKVNQP